MEDETANHRPVIGHRDRPELPEPDGGLGGRFEGGMDKMIHAEFADGSPDCRVGNPVHAEPDGGLGGRPGGGIDGRVYTELTVGV